MTHRTILPPANPSNGGIGEYLGQLPPQGSNPMGAPCNDLGDPTIPAGTPTSLLPAPYLSRGTPKPNFSRYCEPETKNSEPVPPSGRPDESQFSDFGRPTELLTDGPTQKPTDRPNPERTAGQTGRPEGEGGEGRIVSQKVKGAGPGGGARGPEEDRAFEDRAHLTPRIVTDPNRFPVGMPMYTGYRWTQFPREF